MPTSQLIVDAGGDPNAQDRYGRTPVHDAAAYNPSTVAISALIAAGADPNARSDNGETPLHTASYAAGARSLLAAGCDVTVGDRNGRSPLHHAAAYAREDELLEVLIDAGADIDARDASEQTLLHRFAQDGVCDRSIVKILVAHGADIDAQDHEGNTPLHLAIAACTPWTESRIAAPLDASANARCANSLGETPQDIARGNAKLQEQAPDAYQRLKKARGVAPTSRRDAT